MNLWPFRDQSFNRACFSSGNKHPSGVSLSHLMSSHVVVSHFAKRYGAVEAVRSVSFSIGRGEIFGLLGPNGAGKTTTLECLVGLREPDAGELSVAGLDVRTHPAEAKQKIGVALQNPALPDKITPREALRLFGSLYPRRLPPETLLERFALAAKADAPFDSLSGGQRQRLSLALAFVNDPELVVLDEPTTALDPQSRAEVHHEILRMREAGHTVLLSTHYLEEAERLCDRIAIIARGIIVAEGRPSDLIAQAGLKTSATLVTASPFDAKLLAAVAGVEALETDGNTVRFQTADASATLLDLSRLLAAHKAEVVDLHLRKATLEEVFLRLTQAEPASGNTRP